MLSRGEANQTMPIRQSQVFTAHRGHQRHIAERAGVSISTVSRVLSNAGGISDAVQQRVLRAAEELGMRSDVLKSHIKLRHVSLFTTQMHPSLDPFYADVLTGIEAECRRQGLHLSYAVVEPGPAGTTFIFDKVKQNHIDGLLLLAIDDRELVERVLDQGLHAVLINAEHPALPIDTFVPDNDIGARLAVQHLIAHGHRRILHLTPAHRPTILRRLTGYRTALEEAGITYDPTLIIKTPMLPEEAYATMHALLGAASLDFTAIFCAGDDIAMGVLRALQEAGQRIPQDVSIVGFNDMPIAAFLSPPLTTVRIEREELGALAVRRLIDRAAQPAQTPFRLELATRLIERQSVAAAAQGVASPPLGGAGGS